MNKKIVSSLLISSLFLASCGSDVPLPKEEPTPKKHVSIATIKKDFFSEQIKLVGKVSSIMETPVSSLSSGVIKDILFEVGQNVKAGQVLAKIDLGSSAYATSYNNANTAYNNSLNAFSYTEESIKNDLLSAKVQLENAKMSKENTYAVTEKQLELAKTQLENIKNTIKNTISTTGISQRNVEIQLKSANDKLDMDKKSFEMNLSSSYINLNNILTLALTQMDSALNSADLTLGVSDKNKNINDSFESYLGAKNIDTKLKAERSFVAAKSSYDSFLSATYGTDRDSLDKKANDAINVLSKIDELYTNITTMLNNSISSSSFTQDTISGMITKASSIQSGATGQGGIIGLKTQLDTVINGINSLKTQYSITIEADNNNISAASSQLDNIKAGNISQLDNVNGSESLTKTQFENATASVKQARDAVDNGLKIAQTNYDSINAKLNSQRIQAKSQIDSAKGGKDLAGIGLDNTSIIAPYDGVITARNIEIGSLVNPGSPAFMIGNNNNIKIKIDINSDDVTNLNLGQIVDIKRQNNSYTGTISLVSPASDPTTKMFRSEVSFFTKPDSLNLGDFVDVYISKDKSKDKHILVPFSSLISLGQGEYNVFLVGSGNIVKTTLVKIGDQNSKEVVITSGLKEGDKVVVSGALNLQDGDLVEESK
ncbi:MAG: efflux RND transporter periplasmic adaptor subunit [Candidatus Gracilibacteria bacterium]|nr:efflux RND transporter periplasmic adaptor subunit [Candidatus Gracilibacteria bacterium]